MARVHKIDDYQFTLDCVNKEFEIIGSNLHWDTFKELSDWSKENPQWFSDNAFTTKEQYLEWKEYFLSHFYDWQPKRISIRDAKREFSMFAFQYGFRYDFDTSEL